MVGASQAAEISAESETSAKSLERRGSVIANLSAPTPRLVLQFCTSVAVCCLCCLVSFRMLQFSANLLMGFDLLMLLVGA